MQPFADSADRSRQSLASDRGAWLSTQLAAAVTLSWTDNRATMISVRGNATSGYRLRIHRLFRQAPDTVWRALTAYVQSPKTATTKTLRAYIQDQQHLIRPASRSPQRTHLHQVRGRHFDLGEIYQTLNQAYFDNRIQADITWMRGQSKRQRTSIRFGSYHHDNRLIRIHRALDKPFVPRYVIEHVVFHEMLHQLVPPQLLNGRWSVHPLAFQQLEQHFPYHREAEQWQQQHLITLLRV